MTSYGTLPQLQHAFVGEEDHGHGALGHGEGVGRRGGGDGDAPVPAGVGDQLFDGAGRVYDGFEAGRGRQRPGVDHGAPEGEQDLRLREYLRGRGSAEVVDGELLVQFGHFPELAGGGVVQQAGTKLGGHREQGPRAANGHLGLLAAE